tara:strand:- start:37 stop:3009 length:2973 start_codon:yes stop_codon:yes gene_type:complete
MVTKIIKLGLIGKSPPGKIKDIFNHLTREKIKKPDLPEVFRASDAPIPPKKESIETMEAINRFVRDNPRQDMAGGGRIRFGRGTSPEGQKKGKALYDKLYKEYVNLIDKGFKEEKLTTKDVPQWDTFVKNKGFKTMSVMYYADERGSPASLLKDKKIQLVKDIIERENNKLDGMYPMKGGKGGASSLFINKVTTNRLGTSGTTPGSIEAITSKLVKETLDKRDDKILKALRVVMNPDYRLTNPVTTEISNLIKGKAGVGVKDKDVLKTLRTFPEYKNIEPDIKYINRIISKLPKGTDTSMGYLLELSQNNTLGRVSFDDWWRLAGDKPEQFAMREALRNWNTEKGKGQFKFYDLNGKPITWKGKGQSLDSNKVLFSYADPNDLGYKNKLYSVFKPDAKTLTKINKNIPNKGVFDLKGNIRNLPEWNELVKVTDGRNKLFNTDMINPLTGEKEKYKDVFEDIYKNVKTTALTTKEGYSRIKSMAGHIDHARGTRVLPFNNLRIVTGQQNQFFNTLTQASQKTANPNLKTYINALGAEVYPLNASIDNQIASIINETSEIGKVVKANKGKPITLQSLREVASSRFLKNKIPNLPEDVINYLTPKAKIAEQVYQETPALRNVGVSNLQKQIAELASEIDPDGCGRKTGATGGRIGLRFGSTECAIKAKNYLNQAVGRGVSNEPPARVSLIKRIISGAGNFIKQGLSPSELFKLENLVGKPALYATAAIEGGLLADDVLRKKEPINVAAAENFLVGNLLNLDADAEKAKNIINDPDLSPAAKTYAQGIIDQDNFRKLSQTYATNLIKNPLFIPSGAKAKADIALENLKNKITNTPETGRMDYESLLADKQDAFTAKEKPFDAPDKPELPSFTSGQLEKRNVPGEFVIDPSFPLPLQKEILVPSYVSPSYSPERPEYETNEFLNQYLKSIGQEPLRPGEGTLFRMNTPQLGLFGTQERFAGGGIAKLAGVPSGPPPSSGPNSQGLPGLLKRGRRI